MATEVSVELTNGKGNPFGFSSYDIEYAGRRIGTVYCGEIELEDSSFSFEIDRSVNPHKVHFFRHGAPCLTWDGFLEV